MSSTQPQDTALELALAHCRVLDLSKVIAGPHLGQMLGDMGADVIHVEPPWGDDARAIPPMMGEGAARTGASFLISNRNKRSVTLNLKTPEGVAMLHRMVEQADVLIESNRPGVTDRLGISWADLRKVNPSLVMVSISGYGQTGPLRTLGGYNQIAQAMGGFMSLTGFADGPPLRTAAIVGDYLASLYAAFGTMVALIHRDRTGEGQHVDASLYESMVAVLGPALQEYLSFGSVRQRTGNWAPTMAPSDVYAARDGDVMIVCGNNRHWAALTTAMGQPELVQDADFATPAARVANVARVDALVGGWAALRARADIVALLEAGGVPCAVVQDTGQVATHPQTLARELIRTMPVPGMGDVPVLGIVPKLSATPGAIRRPPPRLGEHNDDIYRTWLGIGADDLVRLRTEGVI